MLLFLHSILTDPNLRDGHPDLLDGGKVFVEAAALITFAAVVFRIRARHAGFRNAYGAQTAGVPPKLRSN